jgi:uncharacterized protein (DUF2235 family)
MFKKLVVCCDGTWNWPDQEQPTNITKTVRALQPTDREGNPQIVYYDEGIGTQGGRVRRIIDGALGTGLSQNVQQAYRFLADNYADGDQIFLFGFSRGAYTVRSLAGLMGRVGLLHKGDMEHFSAAYALYRLPRKSPKEEAAYKAEKDSFVRKLRVSATDPSGHPERRRFPLVKFIGVWDTVGALGIPAGTLPIIGGLWPNFHDTELNCFIENAYQALGIDEHRGMYQPAIWTKKTDSTPPEEPGRPWLRPEQQHVEQRWFTGAHSNIGGGYPDAGLSDLAWVWMIEKARLHGLTFDEEYVRTRTRADHYGELVDSWARLPWSLRPRRYREVCRADPSTERLHYTVAERLDAQADAARRPKPHPYAPPNLKDFLAPDARLQWFEAPQSQPGLNTEGGAVPPSSTGIEEEPRSTSTR